MQDSDFRFRSCCPRANRNGYAHLDEDNSFAARQKSGADDIAVSTPYAAHTPKTARNAVLRVGNSIRAQMGNSWRAPRLLKRRRSRELALWVVKNRRFTVARIACLSACRRFGGVGENRPRAMPVSTDRNARTCLAQEKPEQLATHDNDYRFVRHTYLVFYLLLIL